jgi:Carboxypeptidase regulatory-like domain
MSKRVRRRGLWAACVAAAMALSTTTAVVNGQESRGTLSGRVTDATGAVLPGTTVTVVNMGTNSTTALITNTNGQYAALYLNPGTYRITVELQGFKKIVNEDMPVRVGDKATLDFRLEPQVAGEEVEVVATRALLESGSATTGQIIDSKLINEIPMGDGTAYGLARLVAGATFERSYALQRPMDNDNLRGVAVSGTMSSEFTLDGSSNVGSSARVAIQPPADSIQEFKVETAAYDAQVGHTGAGSINLALKSGTNQLHGAVSFYNRDDSRSANLFASNANGTGKTPRNYNRVSATLSGPIVKNKTFFLLSYEKLQDDTAEPVTGAVPTEKMRRGDFSELLPLGVLIYDPLTATNVNGTITRQPFPGNIIPANRLSSVAKNVLDFYPLPNRQGNTDLTGNYSVDQPWTYAYHFGMAKIDHEWSSDNRTFVRFVYNFRREERYNWAGEQQGIDISRGGTDRFNYNAGFGHTVVLSPSLIFDLKANFLRFNDNQTPADNAQSIDLAALGFSSDTVPLFRGYEHIPMFNLDGTAATCVPFPGAANPVFCLGGNQNGFNTGRNQPFYNIQFAPTLTKTMGAHTIKLGYDWRSLRQNEVNEGFQGGAFQFDSTYTRQSSATSGRYGQGVAAFVLGLPTNNSFIEDRSTQSYEVVSHGAFVHDDWRVSSKLTLNLGLRYDLELGMTESQNRNIRGFDLTTPNPIQAQAQANFAASTPAGVPLSASDFAQRVRGGYQYLSDQNPHIWDADKNNVQPRLGITYALGPKTMLRGGAGLYIAPFQVNGVPGLANPINQIGYSRNTNATISADNGLTFVGNLSRPVPSAALLQPNGSSLGLLTNLGGNVGTFVPTGRVNAQVWRYTLGIQRELPGEFVAELSYIGQRGQNMPYTSAINYVPEQFRTRDARRDAAAETFLSATVANPFRGLTPENAGSNGATIARSRLLQQYPQFGTLSAEFYDGTNRYDGGYVRLEKRFTKGFMLSSTYTYSRFRETVAPLNPWEKGEERVGTVDRPHRITFASVAELPFGKGRKFGTNWPGLVDALLGGWQMSGRFEWQSGQPLTWNDVYFDPGCGDPKSVLKSTWGHDSAGKKYGVDVPIIDTSCFYTYNGQAFKNASGATVTFQAPEIARGAANIRTFPTTLDSVRFQNQHILDLGLTKNFKLGSRVKLQIRAEALNATNFTIFNVGNLTNNNLVPTSSNFGKLTNLDSSTVIRPRDIQLGAKITF